MVLDKYNGVRKILVIYVGGTIGMQKNSKGVYVPIPNQFLEKVKNSDLHDKEAAKTQFKDLKANQLVLPQTGNGDVRIVYEINEYNPLLDSSNMNVDEWTRIAKDIEKYYKKFDGFVVLHGTDTMAYTSSALSFMLEGLEKPVILTGAQIPIFEALSDAKNNFLSALILAGCCKIPEVCVFFADKLMRGNRTAKISSRHFNAFDSPNYGPLADVGTNIRINQSNIKEPKDKEFRVNTCLNRNVGVLTVFPTITAEMVDGFLNQNVSGLVLLTYGAGNIPSMNKKLMEVLKKAVKNEIVIVNITQCAQGHVSNAYETGKVLENIGIICGSDMTAEAALTKLIYVCGQPNFTYQQKIKMMKSDLRGELTEENFANSKDSNDFILSH